jgi:hypothetical protein
MLPAATPIGIGALLTGAASNGGASTLITVATLGWLTFGGTSTFTICIGTLPAMAMPESASPTAVFIVGQLIATFIEAIVFEIHNRFCGLKNVDIDQ